MDQDRVSSDRLRITVDGVVFDVAYDRSQPGTYHYTRLTPPAVGYGFTSGSSDSSRSTVAGHERSIRTFLAQVDPTTGYIEDDEDET